MEHAPGRIDIFGVRVGGHKSTRNEQSSLEDVHSDREERTRRKEWRIIYGKNESYVRPR